MNIVKRTSKSSHRIIVIGLLLAMVSTTAIGSNWEGVKSFAGVTAILGLDYSFSLLASGKTGSAVPQPTPPLEGNTVQDLTDEDAAAEKLREAEAQKEKVEDPVRQPSDGGTGNLINATTYAFISSAGNVLEDMSSGTTMLLTPDADDTISSMAPVGFDFWFDGVRQTVFSANSNGLMKLNPTQVTSAFTNDLASATNVPQIAPYWDDHRIGNNGKVHYKVVGTAPTRKLVVEWQNMQVPLVAAATAGTATFQAWLFESTGKIEFVYGAIPTATNGYSVGFGSSATQFASVTTAGPTVAYGTANNAQTNAITSGTKYTFTPLIPADPGALSFTAVGLNTMTLNWADNATNELGYVIYRSFDGTNYEFIRQLAAGSTSSVEAGLASNTTYFWRVFPVTEGTLSATASSGSQATTTGTITGTSTVGPTGTYLSIGAAVTAINTSGLNGNVILELQTTYTSVVEVFPLVINTVGSPSNTITIRPTTGATALSIAGLAAAQTLDLSGAAYVSIDGRAGGAGVSQLTVSNTSTTGVPIRLINDARNNTLQYLTVNGVNTSLTGGDIVFSTTTGPIGNSFNTIDNCDIRDGATTPVNGIFSLGTAAAPNANNTISNNLIHEFFSATLVTNGILLSSAAGNLSNLRWTISNNKFFQTPTRTYTTGNIHAAIRIGAETGSVSGGFGYTITGNTIGFASSAGTGTYTMAGAVTNRFIGISVNGGAETTSIQNNTVTAFSLATSSGATTTHGVFSGIHALQGNLNIGTITGNTIGGTGTGHITTTPTTALALNVGINVTGSTTTSLATAVNISNNTIGGFTANGSGSISGIAVAQGQPTITNNTIGSNTIALSMNSPTVAVASTLLNGINVSAGVSPTSITNNIVANFSGAGTGTGAVGRGIVCASTGPATINGNTIHDIAHASTNVTVAGGGTAVQGIQQTGTAVLGANVSSNTIYTLSATNATAVQTNVTGIGYSNPTNGTVTKNRIYDLRNASTMAVVTTPPTASGILVRASLGTLGTFSNNMISLGTSQTTNTQFIGIWNSFVTNTLFVHYNSVHIGGTATAGALPSFGFLRGDNTVTSVITTTVDIKNNILNNTRTGGTGKHYAIGNVNSVPATGWGAGASNNNVLNSPVAGTVGIWGLATDQTFAAWKVSSASDGASLSGVTVTFVDAPNGDLHVSFGLTPTALESGGTVVATTVDFDMQTRPGPAGSVNGGALAPDIGADEFDGVPLDITAPAITYTPFTNTIFTTNRTLSATIVDAGGVATAGLAPRIYYRKNAGAYFSNGCTLFSGTVNSGVWNCIIDYSVIGFGGAATLDVIDYYVIAQDVSGNIASNPAGVVATNVNMVTTPPAPNAYTIIAGTSGTKTVCAIGCDFPTLTGAGGVFAGINAGVVTGNFNVEISGDLVVGEDGSVALNPITEEPVGSNFTVRIYPTGSSPGTPRLITSTTAPAGGFIRLNAADRVTVDGSNGGTGTDRSMTITEANTGTTSAVVWLQNNGADGATGNTVKNLNIVGNSNTTTLIGIGMGATGTASVSTSSLGTNNNTNTIQNNNISKTQFGIYTQGASAAAKNTGNVIAQNLMTTVAPNNVAKGGIQVGFENNITISQNAIDGIVATTDDWGITLGLTSWTSTGFTGNEVTNATVTRNVIGLVQNNGTNSAAGIAVSPALSGTNVISNNSIFGVIANSTPGDLTTGIFVTGGAGSTTNVYFNSVSMTGDRGAGTSASSLALAIGGANPVVNVLNNALFNTQTTASTGRSYAIGLGYGAAGSANFTNLTSNYNDLFTSGANAGFSTITSLNPTVTELTTLAAWQNAATGTGKDANSISANPLFTSLTDLHILNTGAVSTVARAGVTIAGITTDFDGDTRKATPDIGADEFDTRLLSTTSTAGGSVTVPATTPVIVNPGGATAITAVPSVGFAFNGWTVTAGTATFGNAALASTTATIPSSPAGDATIQANFIATYTLTYTAGANGTITGTTPQTVNHGASGTAVTAVPDAGYSFTSWSDGVLTASRTDTNVTANISVTANFAINTYTLTYTAGANGTITGTTPQTVNHGASGTAVTAVPDAGYSFTSWSDGVLTASRTDTNVTANISVTANFAINTYTLTYTAGANGTITGTTPQTVNHGASGTAVTAVPDAGYSFTSWSDGVLTASRTDTNVTANISVTANFAINTYTLTYTAGANGTITGTTPQTVNHGASGTAVTAVPDAGYSFTSWSDGVLTASRTDTNVTANISVTANFAINTYTLTYTAGANGTITGTTPQTVNHGASGTAVTAVPDAGYSFTSWSDGVLTASRTDTNVTANISVTANFVLIDAIAPVITYATIPNTSSTSNPTVNATITDAVGVTGSTIFWSVNGGAFSSNACTMTSGNAQNGTWACTTAGIFSNPSAISYYITATDAASNVGSNPGAGATEPNLYTIGAATIPAGTYTNISLGDGSSFGGNVTVLNVLTLGGIVDVGSFTLTLGCNGTVVGAGTTSYVIGKFAKQFCPTIMFMPPSMFMFPVGTPADNALVGGFGNPPEFSPFTANVTAIAVVPSTLTVNVVDAVLPGSGAAQSASRYWDVTETGDLTADISFTYLNQDVMGTETTYKVLRRSGGIVAIYPDPTNPGGVGTVNDATNTGTATNVINFSQWAAGNLATTASNATVGGRITTQTGRGIYQARVVMIDSGGNTRLARTNPFGYYRFTNVGTGQTYVFSAFDKRYQFVEPSITASIDGDNDGINFVASGASNDLNANSYFDKAPFDFDGDGISDASVWREGENSWYIKRSSDGTFYSQEFGLATDKLAPADFDGDGRTDVAVFRPTEGKWFIWLSQSNSLSVEQFAASGDFPMPSDFDGDGKADLAALRGDGKTFSIKLSSNGQTSDVSFEKIDQAFIPRTGDFDGDGKADIAIFKQSSRTWEVRYDEGRKTVEIGVEGKGDVPLFADFDGDGRSDLGIYNSETGIWTTISSRSGKIETHQNGGGIDQPLLADFDGDGRIDAGVYRNGTWSIRQSVTNLVRSREFGLPTDRAIPSTYVK